MSKTTTRLGQKIVNVPPRNFRCCIITRHFSIFVASTSYFYFSRSISYSRFLPLSFIAFGGTWLTCICSCTRPPISTERAEECRVCVSGIEGELRENFQGERRYVPGHSPDPEREGAVFAVSLRCADDCLPLLRHSCWRYPVINPSRPLPAIFRVYINA